MTALSSEEDHKAAVWGFNSPSASREKDWASSGGPAEFRRWDHQQVFLMPRSVSELPPHVSILLFTVARGGGFDFASRNSGKPCTRGKPSVGIWYQACYCRKRVWESVLWGGGWTCALRQTAWILQDSADRFWLPGHGLSDWYYNVCKMFLTTAVKTGSTSICALNYLNDGRTQWNL